MSFGGNRSMDDNDGTDDNDRSRYAKTDQIQNVTQNLTQIKRFINQLNLPQNSETSLQLRQVNQLCNKSLEELAQLQQTTSTLPDRSLTSSYLPRRTPYMDSRPVFGGSSSRAARLAGSTPYNLSQRQFVPTMRVNVNPTKRVLVTSDPLSTSSKRFLEKLEKASTPLQDARRIPLNSSLKDYFEDSNLLHRSTKRAKLAPPIHATPVATPTIDSNTFRTNPKRWELKEVNPTMKMTEQIIDSCDSKYLNDIDEFKSKDTFGGKITRRDLKREEKKGKTHQTIEVEDSGLELLTNTQPLTMPSSLPKFSFGVNSVPKPSATVIKALDNDFEFTFAEPVLKKRTEKRKLQNDESFGVNTEKPFVFSSPSSAITQILVNGLENESIETNVVKETPVGWGDKFKPKLGSWSCTVCCVNNDSDKTKCVAFEEPKPGAKTANKISLFDNVSNKKPELKAEVTNDKWICYCLYQNSNCDNKCKACSKPRFSISEPSRPSLSSTKPSPLIDETKVTTNGTVAPISGWGDQFKSKTGSWDCPVCCVNNSSDKAKCVACEEPKPGSKSIAEKSSADSWQCFYCKETNNSTTVCKSCDKIKTPIATKSDLDKLYNQPFKFGFTDEKKVSKDESQTNKASDEKLEQSNVLLKASESISHPNSSSNTVSNSFIFGSSAFKDSSKTNAFNINPSTTTASTATTTEQFKFGFSSAPQKSLPVSKSTEITTSSTSDLFGSKMSTPPVFGFNTQVTASSTVAPKPTLSTSAEPSSLFLFGAQSKDKDSSKSTKSVSFQLNDNGAEKSSDAKTLPFQFGKADSPAPTFKSFSPSSSSLFSTTVSGNPPVTTITTVTSFIDKSITSTAGETKNKNTGFVFGMPTTSSSIPSFSSPFSMTSASAATPTTTSVQSTSDQSAPKSFFSFSSSTSTKPFEAAANQINPLVTKSSLTPNATLSSSTSSSMPNGLVFGTSNSTIPSFSLPTTTATTKPNFTFNMGATTNAPTASTENTFGTSNSLFGSNQSKGGFSFGNSSLNSNQLPSFSPFNPTSSNTLSSNTNTNTNSSLNFGLKTNTNFSGTSDTGNKPTNQLFAFGAQNSDQFSSSAPKPLNNINPNPKNDSQFSFGVSSNTSTGQTNTTPNLFGNAISAPQNNSLSFNQLAPNSAVNNPSPFTFGTSFGSNTAAPQMPIQPSAQQSAPQFNFNAQPSFNFGSGASAAPQAGAPIFQFSADQSTGQAVVPSRNIKKAKRRLNPT